jgi:ATP-binding cassette subfamily B (MDR/TAP) protein 6
MQYSDREMSQLSFNHLLNLSFAFHMRRKTGEILRILDRGAAINHTLELILFNIIPTFFDIIIALVVFAVRFEWALTVVIACVMAAYVTASVVMTKWRTQIRRQMNDRDVITRGIHTDCLLNYETVKYFGGEQHEAERYRSAIRDYQVLEYRVMISLNMLNLVQNFIISLGLLVGSMIVALRVTKGTSNPSDFVFFITYLAQLYGPLNSLGYIYRSVNQSLVDTERLLKLLNEPTDVNDRPNAPDLIVEDGEIEFDNVSFSYDNRTTALNGVSFKVPKGSSVALVGESGAGKSTVLRLLYRFYDLKDAEGRILIDGQDIREVTQTSLRKAIGVVPQDSVLFNTSIGYNIGYGKFDATPEEIMSAAQAAQMHDRIMGFPDGYETKVGERGVRLSGGEKQRVAIARTLLKNPPILLLDEATSALDTSTEKDIQKALQNLQKGRSSLSIAHRLSTIASADVILVLKDGQIVEQGNHQELLARGGVFATMWADQISATGDPTVDRSVDNEPVLGYQTEPTPAAEAAVEAETPDAPDAPQEHVASGVFVDIPEAVPATLASTEEAADEPPPLPAKEPVIPPSDGVATTTPLAFPTSEDTASQKATSERIPLQTAGGVTFGDSVNSPPSRSGTPDPDAEMKRKRTTSQNFQRFARKISLTTRRPGSGTVIPGLKRESSLTTQGTHAGAGEGTAGDSTDSATASVQSDIGKAKSKKDKKEKRKSLF